MSDQKLESIQKKIAYTYGAVVTAKIRNFYKRSFWKYTASAALYAGGLRLVRGNSVVAPATLMIFVNFLLIILSIVLMIIVISSVITARRYGDKHMIYTFNAEGISILNEINGMEESHPWDWIMSIEVGRKALFLRINHRRYFEIILDKNKISPEEQETLLSWKKHS